VRQHAGDIHTATGKKVFQGPPLQQGFRVQGEGGPGYAYIDLGFQFFNTPGNEITPRSDVVGKDFKVVRIRHGFSQRA